jgi:hypothetical protein
LAVAITTDLITILVLMIFVVMAARVARLVSEVTAAPVVWLVPVEAAARLEAAVRRERAALEEPANSA